MNLQSADRTSQNRIPTKQEADDVAIIGVSGRYPLSKTLAELWEHLKAGDNCITEAPDDRWSASPDWTVPRDTRFSEKHYGGFLDSITQFDHHVFGIDQEEVLKLPPELRLFLETAWETFEDAGYTRLALRDLQTRHEKGIGVFVGTMYNQYPWRIPSLEQAVLTSNETDWQIANRTSHFFNLTGPSIAINSACSSSLTAVHIACESLKQEGCSMALAGGINLTLDPSKYDILKRTRFLGSGSRSKSFGTGDGYIPGEGVGAVLLKPLSLAIRDHDRIYAVIKSSFVNHSGGRQMYTAPDPKQQAQLIAHSISRSGIDPSTIGYVESAANGSELGDPIEVIALHNAFTQYTDKKQYCALGSVKSNLGHLEAASGISQISKVLLQLKHGTLVPTINAEPRNPNIRLEDTAFYLQEETRPWDQFKDPQTGGDLPRRSMINSFGAGGSYANLILEEFVDKSRGKEKAPSDPQENLFAFSAKTEWSLMKYLEKMQDYLKKNASVPIGDVACSLQAINHALEYRAVVLASSVQELLEKIEILSAQKRNSADRGIYISSDRTAMPDRQSPPTVEQALEERDLEQLAQYWTGGARIDFRQLDPNSAGRSIDLPAYAFDHRIGFAFEPAEEIPAHDDFYLNIVKKISSGELPEEEVEKIIAGAETRG